MAVSTSTTPGPTATLTMLLLKQQPPGEPLPAPVLVYRSPVSGEAFTCSILYESADCSGPGIVPAPASGAACLDAAGHAWVAPPGVAGTTVVAGSRGFAVWDGATQSVAQWSCSPAPVTAQNVFVGEDRGVPPRISGRISYVPAD
ncbi:MAG TPA: hypothetical protein VFL83_09655 [Anaeromyxobacter sp.]|nr:hypothetical protein [Anaeromyxobacter sp.]